MTLWENREVRERMFVFLLLWRHKKYFSHTDCLRVSAIKFEKFYYKRCRHCRPMRRIFLCFAENHIMRRRARDFMHYASDVMQWIFIAREKKSLDLFFVEIFEFTLRINSTNIFSIETLRGPAMSHPKSKNSCSILFNVKTRLFYNESKWHIWRVFRAN